MLALESDVGRTIVIINLILALISATINGITYVYYRGRKRERWIFLGIAGTSLIFAALAFDLIKNGEPCEALLHTCITLTISLFVAVPLVLGLGKGAEAWNRRQ